MAMAETTSFSRPAITRTWAATARISEPTLLALMKCWQASNNSFDDSQPPSRVRGSPRTFSFLIQRRGWPACHNQRIEPTSIEPLDSRLSNRRAADCPVDQARLAMGSRGPDEYDDRTRQTTDRKSTRLN